MIGGIGSTGDVEMIDSAVGITSGKVGIKVGKGNVEGSGVARSSVGDGRGGSVGGVGEKRSGVGVEIG